MISGSPSGPSAQAETSNRPIERVGLNHQAVIAGRDKRIWQTGEQSLAVVMDLIGLAVHQSPGADDRAAGRLTDRLMSQANAQDRNLAERTA